VNAVSEPERPTKPPSRFAQRSLSEFTLAPEPDPRFAVQSLDEVDFGDAPADETAQPEE
jgi:hypothetical protein